MRRLIGLIALAVLIFGGWWLIRNDGDLSRIRGGQIASKEAAPAGAGKQASEAPSESTRTPVFKKEQGSISQDAAKAPSAPVESPAAETPAASAAPEASSADREQPAAESTAETPAAETPAAGDAPTFDIVRVEPSGETVIAGLAAPNTTVDVLDGPEAVATAEANDRGEWALILDKPLPPGSHDLAIRTTSKDKSTVTLSDQRVVIAVPEEKNEKPLVVLNSPDAPSSVMQLPKESDIASAPPATAGEGAPPAAAPGISTAPSAVPPAATAPTRSETAVAPEATPSEPSPPSSPVPGESEIAVAPDEPARPSTPEPPAAASPRVPAPPAASEAPDPGGPTTPARPRESDIAVAEPPIDAEGSDRAGVGPAAGGATPPVMAMDRQPTAPSSAAPAKPEPPTASSPAVPAEPEPQVGVAAVEAETDGSLYIAGTATTKDPVRVYLDDQLIGEAEPTEGGTWLLETKREVEPGDYTVRADQVESDSGKVIVRAEVPFQREIAVAVLEQSTESGDNGPAKTSGTVAEPTTVIIKRGDNLWRISRELYGRGIRYSTIYQANRDQIRDPDEIYPGQVFVLPAGDTAWQN